MPTSTSSLYPVFCLMYVADGIVRRVTCTIFPMYYRPVLDAVFRAPRDRDVYGTRTDPPSTIVACDLLNFYDTCPPYS